MNEIAKCPQCNAGVGHVIYYDLDKIAIACDNCGYQIKAKSHETEEDLIVYWNSHQLASCPFCGGNAKIVPMSKQRGKWFGYVQCENVLECGAEIGGCDLKEAIRRWNERVKPGERNKVD